MKAGFRPQYYRIRRMVQRVRAGSETGYQPNSRDFTGEVSASRAAHRRPRSAARRGARPAPLESDQARHGCRLTDETSACLRCGSIAGRPLVSPSRARCWLTTKRPIA
jgi:hypothetical protein